MPTISEARYGVPAFVDWFRPGPPAHLPLVVLQTWPPARPESVEVHLSGCTDVISEGLDGCWADCGAAWEA